VETAPLPHSGTARSPATLLAPDRGRQAQPRPGHIWWSTWALSGLHYPAAPVANVHQPVQCAPVHRARHQPTADEPWHTHASCPCQSNNIKIYSQPQTCIQACHKNIAELIDQHGTHPYPPSQLLPLPPRSGALDPATCTGLPSCREQMQSNAISHYTAIHSGRGGGRG
jgi:hypothetical protein